MRMYDTPENDQGLISFINKAIYLNTHFGSGFTIIREKLPDWLTMKLAKAGYLVEYRGKNWDDFDGDTIIH